MNQPGNEAFRVIAVDGSGNDAATRHALEACRRLRRIVFVDEQAVPEELEWDGLDGESIHFLALGSPPPDDPTTLDSALDSALGTARVRMLEDYAKAERVAVRRELRRCGVGRAVMEALEQRARAHGRREIHLNAQLTALAFYESLGYRAHGEVFLEAGIEHRAMVKRLA